MKNIINSNEEALLRRSLETALEKGAQKARAVLSKGCLDSVAILNGQVDKVSHCNDRSISLNLFVDGRYGVFSINRLEPEALEQFIVQAIDTVRMLAPDPCRDLPDPSRLEKTALTGRELGVCDEAYDGMDAEGRLRRALGASVFADNGGAADSSRKCAESSCECAENSRECDESAAKGWKLISEEGEYSDSVFDTILMDSNGAYCRHTQTVFEFGVEVTVEDSAGNKYSSYHWDSSPFADRLSTGQISLTALKRAVAGIGAVKHSGGRFNMVLTHDCADKLVNPLFNALNGYSIQQNKSFLCGLLGSRAFSEGLTIRETGRSCGESGSRLFDSEGVSLAQESIIERGVINKYFITTYIGAKMGCAPTNDDVYRPVLTPWPRPMGQDEILRECADGILVTGFNGGNCNATTGDYSYGIEGFFFRGGKIAEPVREMLITGNLLTLWNSLLAVGNDPRPCMSRQIPTLAFSNVEFRG